MTTDSLLASREVRLASRPTGIPDASNFIIVDRVLGEPKAGDALVENLFMSVDPYMRGRMVDRTSYIPPFELGQPLDGAAVGRVVRSRAEGLSEGDIVLHRLGWRTRTVAPARAFTRIASPASPLSAYLGVLGMTGFTAYIGILEIAGCKAGETVFVSAAAGAVGSVACQIARITGCQVIGSAGSDAKTTWLRDVAQVAALNYRTSTDLTASLRALAPTGIDAYFDNVGGSHLEAAIGVMKQHGRIALCGMIGQYNTPQAPCAPRNLDVLVGKRLTMRGFLVGDHEALRGAFLTDMTTWLRDGAVRAEETIVHGIESAPDAFIGLFSGENTGKMIVDLSQVQ